MNVEDSEQMELFLQRMGLSEAPSLEDAEIVLLNTCSVRRKPEEKAFSLLGELKKLKAQKRELIIGVCGCMAQLRAEEIRKRCPHVDFIVGTAQVSQIPSLIAEVKQARRFEMRLELPPRKGAIVTHLPARVQPETKSQKIKAFIPIQYGCDKFCTFCIVPITRGRERSRPTGDILNEIRALAEKGIKEFTLLGQTVNSYGKNLLEGKVPFSRLLWKISEIDGVERIRFTSPYPRDFHEDLIRTIRDCEKVMEHVHLPLQSGDNIVLKEMRRVYTVEQFEEIYWKLREIPGIAITTDIIVGFPGETEKQFENTLRVVEELRFDSAFMFAYSPRPGTPAAQRRDQIPQSVKKKRLQELIALQNRITCELNSAEVGKVFEVMVEGFSEKEPDRTPRNGKTKWMKGLTRHNKTVHFLSENGIDAGEIVKVRAKESHLWGFYGDVLQSDGSRAMSTTAQESPVHLRTQ